MVASYICVKQIVSLKQFKDDINILEGFAAPYLALERICSVTEILHLIADLIQKQGEEDGV